MRLSLLQALVVVSGLAGCSPSAFRAADPDRDRLDALTAYTLALSKRDYREAARHLAPADRSRIAGPEEGILPEYRERVRAIRRTTLLSNPLIEVRRGLIYGIPDILPVLASGSADTLAPDTLAEAAAPMAATPMAPDQAPARPAEEELHRVARSFFRAVRARDWKRALAYVHAGEREGLADAKGGMKETVRRGLAAADTSGWNALALRDGKLTGVFLLYPGATASRSD